MHYNLQAVFADVPDSPPLAVESVTGAIPKDLAGTALRNGPGIQLLGTDRLHLLDGLSLVVAARFEGGEVTLAARHLESPAYQQTKAGKQTKRHVFTNKPGGRWKNVFDVAIANSASHDVYAWGGKIYATDALGHFRMNRETLATEGPGELDRLRKGQAQTSPMPRVDEKNDRLVCYIYEPGMLGNDKVRFVEYDRQWKIVAQSKHALPAKNLALHDLAVTDDYYVVARWGSLNLGPVLAGTKTLVQAIAYQPDACHVYLLPRRAGVAARTVKLAPQQIFHFFNAFQDGGAVYVDSVSYDGGVDFHAFSAENVGNVPRLPPKVRRHRIDASTWTATSEDMRVSGELPDINPAFHGRRQRYGYVASPDPQASEGATSSAFFWFRGVTKVDFDEKRGTQWLAQPSEFAVAPQFAQRVGASGEDDGYVIAWVLDSKSLRSSIAILDARSMQQVARVHLSRPLATVSHAHFAAR